MRVTAIRRVIMGFRYNLFWEIQNWPLLEVTVFSEVAVNRGFAVHTILSSSGTQKKIGHEVTYLR
jgi:hypothetical protein